MFSLITYEYENSQPVTRQDLEMVSAYRMAKDAGYYKAQIVNQETGVIEYEL